MPYTLFEMNGKDIIVLISKGAVKFRRTVVKPYQTNDEPEQASQPTMGQYPSIGSSAFRDAIRVIEPAYSEKGYQNLFQTSQTREFQRLMD